MIPLRTIAKKTTFQLQRKIIMSGSEEEEEFNDEEAANDDDVVTQELANSLKKISKVVTNLMARADCEPFREPGDWKGLQVSTS